MKVFQKSLACFMLCASLLVFGAWTTNAVVPETRYADAQLISAYANETIAYDTKEITTNTTVRETPEYEPIGGLSNSCGAVAGAIIVGFYDKYLTNLIPNWDPCFPNGKYRMQDYEHVPAVMNQLYTLMRTNVDDVGVSQSDCLNGLRSYVNQQGYSLSYSSVASTSSLDYAACKNAIDNNKPILIFSRPCDLYFVATNTDGDDVRVPTNISGAHIMVVYGYEEIRYYNNGSLFRTDIYLMARTGWTALTYGLYQVSTHTLNAAYVVSIS